MIVGKWKINPAFFRYCALCLRGYRGDQRLDVSEGEGECLQSLRIAGDLRNVIGHDHAVVADLLVNTHGLKHVHIAVVNKCFLKIEESAADVAEVNVEDFSALPEITDDVE